MSMTFQSTPPTSPTADAELIKDTTTAQFTKDVLETSRDVPVLVDFWAPWCGPCRQLTPVLEKAVRAAKGKIRLVKMNIDEHPAVAGQLGVQSIPAVFAFRNGRPVDGFMGALPEGQVKAFIDRLLGGEGPGADVAEMLTVASEALEKNDLQTAAEIYAAVLAEDKENPDALAGLAKCYLKTGDTERAENTLALAPQAKQSHAAIAGVRAMLDLAKKAPQSGEISKLEAAVTADPNDHQARFDLALALNAQGQKEQAVEHLLTLMRKSRAWNDDAARKQLVQFFDAWGPKDEMTLWGRKQLSILLFS
ncbi:MAG: thioredoxin [Hyphomicrobiaceae bacterium]